MGTTIKDRHNFFRNQEPDFVGALQDILDSADLGTDEKYEALVKELERMWPCEVGKFLDTEHEQFEVMVDNEVFTCLIIAQKDKLHEEVIQYFKEMLSPMDAHHGTFELSQLTLKLEPM